MTKIYPIAHQGGETAGSPAKTSTVRVNNVSTPQDTTPPPTLPPQLDRDTVSFQGGESAGSVALREDSGNTEEANENLSFKGDGKNSSSGSKALLTVGAIAATAVAAIVALGFAGKNGSFSKITNETLKKVVKTLKLETAATTCYNWCKAIKGKGQALLETIKGWFTKKGG